ncbi:MAG: hypothetical protein JJT81_12585 [Rubellimicrobium sp.]|nr:hypothetical protein [Rubellimicrobium sp.]
MQDWSRKDARSNRQGPCGRGSTLALICAAALGLGSAALRAEEAAPADSPAETLDEGSIGVPEDLPVGSPVDPDQDEAPHTHDGAAPQIPDDAVVISGVLEPCLLPHGNPETYRATLRAIGWTDIPTDERDAALDRLAEIWLPVTGRIEGSWADHLAHRPQARAFWADFAGQRTLMERDGKVLLLAGFEDLRGNLRVECWTGGDHQPMTQSFFDLLGAGFEQNGIRMTQVEVPATGDFPQTGYFIIRMEPPPAIAEHLTGGDGIRTTITFPFPTTL